MKDTEKLIDLDPLLVFPMFISHSDVDNGKRFKIPRTRTIYDCKEWTPKLRENVAEYLSGLSDEQYAALLPELEHEAPDGDRDTQIAFMTTELTPSSLGTSAHYMTVKTVPTLKLLIESEIGYRNSPNFDYEAIGYWLKKHASEGQQAALIQVLVPDGYGAPPLSDRYDIDDWVEATKLPPYQIQQAWKIINSDKSS